VNWKVLVSAIAVAVGFVILRITPITGQPEIVNRVLVGFGWVIVLWNSISVSVYWNNK
jgi:hypothetical protein